MTLSSRPSGGLGSYFGTSYSVNSNNLYNSYFAHELRNHNYFLTLTTLNRSLRYGNTNSNVHPKNINHDHMSNQKNADESMPSSIQKETLKENGQEISTGPNKSLETTETVDEVKVI